MKRWTHREYLTRLAYLEDQWNRPDRSDHYQMQTAMRVQQVLKPHIKVNAKSLRAYQGLFFGSDKPIEKKPRPTKEEIAASSKASKVRWFGMTGFKQEKK